MSLISWMEEKRHNNVKKMNLSIKIGDPRISQIDKIFAENGPKFLEYQVYTYFF